MLFPLNGRKTTGEKFLKSVFGEVLFSWKKYRCKWGLGWERWSFGAAV